MVESEDEIRIPESKVRAILRVVNNYGLVLSVIGWVITVAVAFALFKQQTNNNTKAIKEMQDTQERFIEFQGQTMMYIYMKEGINPGDIRSLIKDTVP